MALRKKLAYEIDSVDMYFILRCIRDAAMGGVEDMRAAAMQDIAEGGDEWRVIIDMYERTTGYLLMLHGRMARQWKRHSGAERRGQIDENIKNCDLIRDCMKEYVGQIEKAARERAGCW